MTMRERPETKEGDDARNARGAAQKPFRTVWEEENMLGDALGFAVRVLGGTADEFFGAFLHFGWAVAFELGMKPAGCSSGEAFACFLLNGAPADAGRPAEALPGGEESPEGHAGRALARYRRESGRTYRDIAEAVAASEAAEVFRFEDGLEFAGFSRWMDLRLAGGIRTEADALEAVVEGGYAPFLSLVPARLRTPAVCVAAVEQRPDSLKYVPETLKTEALCRVAVEASPWALRLVPEALKTEAMCTLVAEREGWTLCFVPEELRTPELCRKAAMNSPAALKHVPLRLRSPELCLATAEHAGERLELLEVEDWTPDAFCQKKSKKNRPLGRFEKSDGGDGGTLVL